MYAVLARYYDLIHKRLTEDLGFVRALAGEYGGPILELGCGTGRLLLPLVKAGYLVTGVDNAPSMLLRAQARLDQEGEEIKRRASLIEADIRRLTLPGDYHSFRLALFSYNTLLHFRPHEVKQTLKHFSKQLQQDGRLFIDIANPFVIEDIEYEDVPVLENTWFDPITGETIIQKSLSKLNLIDQCLHTTWYFEASKEAEQAHDSITVEVNYWYYFPHQIELLLQQSGFRLEKIWGDYDRSDFHEESRRLLVLASPLI